METNNLIKFSSYARFKGVSTMLVYTKAKNNEVDLIIIDGVKFIKLSEQELKEYQEFTGNKRV